MADFSFRYNLNYKCMNYNHKLNPLYRIKFYNPVMGTKGIIDDL